MFVVTLGIYVLEGPKAVRREGWFSEASAFAVVRLFHLAC
jgi:hypothetical protein